MRLIATSPAPLPIEALQAIFPKIPWRATVRALSRKGALVFKDHGTLNVRARLLGSLFEDTETRSAVNNRWLRRLRALAKHSDTALLLSLFHLRAGSIDLAVEAITDIAEGLEPGNENVSYREFLRPFLHPSVIRRLRPRRRVRLLNAFALCLARSGQHKEALQYFRRLVRLSRQTRDRWGLGQAYINAGVTYVHARDIVRGMRCYERAVRHARATRDLGLLGRSLHNLGMLRLTKNPGEGLALIESGLKTKLAVGDIVGAVGALIGQGMYHSTQRQWRLALGFYQRAVVLARRFDLRHLLGLALTNVGSSHVDLGDPGTGIPAFQQARRIGEGEGFSDVVRFAVQGEAVADSRRERFVPAMNRFLELAELHRLSGDVTDRMKALHDAGLMAAGAGRRAEALHAFAASRHLAERQQDQIAIYLSRHAAATTVGLDPARTAKRLSMDARAEIRRGHPLAAGKLWESLAGHLLAHPHSARDRVVRKTAESAIRCYEQAQSPTDVVRVYKLLCVSRRDAGDPREALKYAKLIAQRSASATQMHDRILAIDEQACCYQRLGNLDAAERLHRKALALAEGTGQAVVIATPLNNLGLLLRNTGRAAEAIQLLSRAEQLAESVGDMDFAATVAKNKALVLCDADRNSEAARLLRAWRTKTARLELWAHHAAMLHGLANIAYVQGRVASAASLYQATLKYAGGSGAERTANEAAQNYVSLLTDEVRRFFRKGDFRAASDRLDVARQIADKYGLTEHHRSVLLAAAIGYWRLGTRHYANSTRAYLLAMAEIDDTSNEMLRIISTIGCELVLNFYHLPVTYTQAQIDVLIDRTREWLKKSAGSSLGPADQAFLLWPLATGGKIAAGLREGRALSAKAIAAIVAEDFKQAVAGITRKDPPGKTGRGAPSRTGTVSPPRAP